jgi:hypothetical protein
MAVFLNPILLLTLPAAFQNSHSGPIYGWKSVFIVGNMG